MQEQVSKQEAEVRQEAQLVRQVAEASLTMSESLSGPGQARCVAKRIAEVRTRASNNRSSASQNRALAVENTNKAESLRNEALVHSIEAQKLQVFTCLTLHSAHVAREIGTQPW